MKKTVVFTACDINNLKYAKLLVKSFKYFHPDIDFVLFTNAKSELPEGVKVVDISGDMAKLGKDLWYMQKPYFADRLFKEGYEAVLGLDADMIILGNLDYIFNHEDYDLGTVLNFNPRHFRQYGKITFEPIHMATEYYNCGLVMMRNHKMVQHWLKLCQGKFFQRMPYKEQDLLNIVAHFGEYTVKCFDDADDLEGYYAWHGLLATSEVGVTVVEDKDIIIPRNENGYPTKDVKFKVFHPAEGQVDYDKLNYRIIFPAPVVERITEILK